MGNDLYIRAKHLPPSLYLNFALVMWLFADRYHWPQWAVAVIATLWGLLAIGQVIRMFTARAGDPVYMPQEPK